MDNLAIPLRLVAVIQSLHSLPTLLGSLVALDRNQLLPLVQFLRIKSMSL
jgi:hypothetical protein